MNTLSNMISKLHIDNQYSKDVRYNKLYELINICIELDEPLNFNELVSQYSLEKLLNIHNLYCYKYYDDEDIIYSQMTISIENMQILANTYKNVISRKSQILDNMFGMLSLDRYYNINDDRLDIYSTMYEILSICMIYFSNINKNLPHNLFKIIQNLIEEIQNEIILNPLDNNYHNVDNLQLEMLIMINLAAKYIKIIHIWCNYHNIKFNQLYIGLQNKYVRLLNNYIILIYKIAFP